MAALMFLLIYMQFLFIMSVFAMGSYVYGAKEEFLNWAITLAIGAFLLLGLGYIWL